MELSEPAAIVNTHILYLNNCRPNGCAMTRGNDDSRKNTASAMNKGSGTLSALTTSQDFAAVKACVSAALAPFAITVTDTDPGNVPHFEMIVAGNPSDIGWTDGQVEGIAPYLCATPGNCGGNTYIPNAITFAFGNGTFNGKLLSTTELCGVALQEAAHGWTLDHATSNTDPMTYKAYSTVTPLSFQNNAPCGSDCIYSCANNPGASCNAFGVVCSGTNTTGTHVCMENNQATQNEVTILSHLFGPAAAAAPTVSVTAPTANATVHSGTDVTLTATCASADGVAEIDLLVDDSLRTSATTSPATASVKNLGKGTHTVQAVCGTTKYASASQTITFTVSDTCTTAADCSTGQVCSNSMCIAGPTSAGGLGATCAANSDCESQICGTSGSVSACVTTCDPSASSCPDGFDCLEAGSSGVCWASSSGGGSGGGGCNTGGAGGPVTGGLLFGMFLLARRRRTR